MKQIIPFLAFLLFLSGLLIFFAAILVTGIGFYTPFLIISTLIGLVLTLSNKKIAWIVMLIVSTAWLLRYFEHTSYLILYDLKNMGRWLITIIPLLLSFLIFGLILKEKFSEIGKTFKCLYWALIFIVFLSIGFISFIHKSHIDQFNCWYIINDYNNEFKILFAAVPDHTFEATSKSKELKEIVKKEGLTYQGSDRYYCPETKVRVITCFKKIVGLEIIGFRNTVNDKLIQLKNPIGVDIDTIKGDKLLLQPVFNLGD